MTMTSDDLGSAIQDLFSAISSGNTQKVQEAIRQWNLTYTNQVAEQYGQNFGVGQPAPPGAPTLAAGQAVGQVGYIPGQSGFNADQTLAGQLQYANIANQQAGLTGVYTAPTQSQYSPGTWVQTQDPSGVNGTQFAQVLPSGQLQRMGLAEAQARGFQNNATPIGYQQFMALASAPPTGTPQQTIAGLTGYSNLNTAAQNQALAQAGVTGYYQAPAPVLAPGTANDGSSFFQQDQATQQAYMDRFGDAGAALTAWTNATNTAINESRIQQGLPPLTAYGYGGNQGAQQTLQAQNQYFTQANELAKQYGQYYQPGMPGQAGQAGVNMPGQGQLTLANIAQQNAIAQKWAEQYGYVPQFDANGQPIFQAGANGNPASTLAAQQQTYAQQMGMIKQAADLQANPFRQQQAIGQMGNLLAGGGVAGFSAPNTVAGVGTAGGNTQGGMGYLSQMIQDIRDPTANQASMNDVLNAIPTPNKINSNEFLRAAPSTQSMVLQGMQEKYGLDPKDALAQIQNTLPQFKAPTTMGAVKR